MGWGVRLVSFISSLPLLKRIVKKSIHSLCEAGDYEEVKKIIESGSTDVNITEGKPFYWTPLMQACYGGHYNVVVLLLQHGADVHIKSSRDWTALHMAAPQNHLRIANRLLREGAKPNDVINLDELHHTALMYVSDKGDRGYVEVARTLLKHGADVNIRDEKNSPPLLYAIQENDEKMVKLFWNIIPTNGGCLLIECARTSASMCKLLVEHGAEMELAMKGAGKTSGDTALHVTCFYGEADIVKVLVEGGADTNRENEMGLTPLMIATKQEHLDTVKSLAQFKLLDIDHLHKETGVSAAILAASNGMINICKVLLDHGAYPEVEGMKITNCIPKRLKKKFNELFQAYEV